MEVSVARRLSSNYLSGMFEHPFIRLAIYAVGIYIFLNVYAALISDRLLFRPMESGYDHLPNEVRIPVGEGESLAAVWMPNPETQYTLLFSHGNGEDLSRVYPFLVEYYKDRFSVLAYDYRGYGTSDGKPTYKNSKEDVEAAYRWLTEVQGVEPSNIIAIGRSLGGALAVHTAANHPVGGLICECSFASAFRVKTHIQLLPWDKFNSEKWIQTVNCPVLIVHGKEDRVIPFSHGLKLYHAAPEPKQHLWIEGARHMDYAYVAEELYLKSIDEFVQTLDKRRNEQRNVRKRP